MLNTKFNLIWRYKKLSRIIFLFVGILIRQNKSKLYEKYLYLSRTKKIKLNLSMKSSLLKKLSCKKFCIKFVTFRIL